MLQSQLALMLVDVGDNISFASALVVIVAMLLQAGIFFMCMVLLSRLWHVVFAAFQGSDEPKAKILVQLLGGVSAEGEGGRATASGKVKLAGSGALGSVLVLCFGCLAIYLIGHHSAGTKKRLFADFNGSRR